MITHYILMAYRGFRRNRSSFLINLVGLTTGLTCTLLIFLWVTDELKIDQFHAGNVFQVMEFQTYSGELMATTSTPGPLAQALQEEIPEIEYAATLTWIAPYTLTVNDNQNFKAEGWHVGTQFFEVLNFPLLIGGKQEVLADKNSIVLSRSMAIKLFGSVDDAIGKEIEVQHESTYLVSGVFEDISRYSSYQFDFVMSFEDFKDKEENSWVLSWGNNGPRTVIKLSEGSEELAVSAKISGFVREKDTEDNVVTLFLASFSDRYLYGSYKNGKQDGGRIEYVRLFSVIAVFILVIACINFMNLSTARATRRAKEVGVRKAVGADRRILIGQYIGESTLISILSLVMALIIAFLFLPQFNTITGKQIVLELSPELIIGSLLITVITGLLAGSYPAVYLSHFKPAVVLKGDIRMKGGELWARKGLVIFQFTLSIILIIAVLTVYRQIEYVQNKNLGYDKSNLLYFYQEGKVTDNLEVFLNGLKRIPGVIDASSIGHDLLGQQNNTSGVDWEGKSPDTRILFENVRVNFGMLELLDLKLKEGRFFSKDYATDSAKIIFNETAIKAMGLEEPAVGQHITLWDDYDMEIIGVVEDFHFQSLHEAVDPLFIRLAPETTWVVMARIENAAMAQALNEMTSYYEAFNPGFTFDYFFIDNEYQELYAAERRVSTLSRYFAGFAVLISSLGLLGLAAFTAERKVKEIGIRKVLGASVSNIVYLLTQEFSKLVFISILIAVPISYFLLDQWLDDFAYRIDLSVWFFVEAGVLALLIAWITVSTQAYRAARANPSESLRSE